MNWASIDQIGRALLQLLLWFRRKIAVRDDYSSERPATGTNALRLQ
jgi:hypothetical protein